MHVGGNTVEGARGLSSVAGNEQGVIASLMEHCFANAPLRSACERGDLAAVQDALGRVDPQSRAARSAMQVAISNGQSQVVRYFLREGVSTDPPDAGSSAGSTSGPATTAEQRQEASPYLIQAALADSPDIISALLEHGVKLSERGHAATLERGHGARVTRASLVTTALGAAAWTLKTKALSILADQLAEDTYRGIDATAEVRPWARSGTPGGRLHDFAWAQGASALILAVHAAGRSESRADELGREAVAILLARRANPDVRNELGDSALHIAARFGLSGTLEALLQEGADLSLRNSQGETPEVVAVRAGRSPCAEALRVAGAAAGSQAMDALVALEQEEEFELARQDRQRERQREKKGRKKERQRALLRDGANEVCGGSIDVDESTSAGVVCVDESSAQGANASGQSIDPKLGSTELRERIVHVRRECSRAARQLRQMAQRHQHEWARAREVDAVVAELKVQAGDLRHAVDRLEAPTLTAERSERHWRVRAQSLGENREEARVHATKEAEAHNIAVLQLREELEALTGSSQNDSLLCSFEAERTRRVAAEERCKELEVTLTDLALALRSAVNIQDLPPVLVPGHPAKLCPEHASLHRQLHEQQRKHSREMRDLVDLLNQQIENRDAASDNERDSLFGSGLPCLLARLKSEGLVNSYELPASLDSSRALRLWEAAMAAMS